MRRYIFCSFAFVLLYPTAIDLYLVGLPRIAEDLGASTAQLHYAFSIYLAGMATTMWLAGKWADALGRKPVAIVGAITFTLASFMATSVTEPTAFFAARFAQGIGAGSCYVVAFAILRDTLDDQLRAKVLSMLNGITCILPVVAPVVGHLIMLTAPWQSLFFAMSAMGALALLIALVLFRETRPARVPRADNSHTLNNEEALTLPYFVRRVLMASIAVTIILTYVNVSPMLIMDHMGLSRGQYSLVMTGTALAGMSTSFLSPWLIARLPARALVLGAQSLFLASALLLGVSSLVEAGNALKLAAFALLCIGFSLGFGVITSQALSPFHQRAGLASSVLGIAQICSAAVYIWLMGLVGVPPLGMLAGLLVLGALANIALIRADRRSRTEMTDDQTPVPTGS